MRMTAMYAPIHLPDDWTMEQVEFLHDLIDLLQEAVWQQYGEDLCEYWSRPGSNRDLFEDDQDDQDDDASTL